MSDRDGGAGAGARTRGALVPSASATLEQVHDAVWAMLGRGVVDRRHGWHLITLATVVGADDGAARADARTVVLRGADRGGPTLLAHTDARSDKRAQIGGCAGACVLAYDLQSRQQARMRVLATVRTDGALVDRQWSATRPMSRRCYLAPDRPGARSEAPTANLPGDLLHGEPDAARSEEGRANFAVIEMRVQELDWLHLAHDGHRRARFVYGAGGVVAESCWLAP